MADDNVFDAVVEKHEKKKEQAKNKRQEFEESVEKQVLLMLMDLLSIVIRYITQLSMIPILYLMDMMPL